MNKELLITIPVEQKEIFRKIKNYLAGRFIGATRDRALLEEVLKCVFCKYYLLQNTQNNIELDDPSLLSKKYREVFVEIKTKFPFVFTLSEEIELDPLSILYIHTELSQLNLLDSNRDVFGDMYEVFVSTGIREEEGQFFTPKNGIDLLVSIIDPKIGEKILDPAAGAGGFLGSAYHHLKESSKKKGLIGSEMIYGIEKDSYLARLAAIRVALMSLTEGNIFCGDSLSWVDKNNDSLAISSNGFFDVILTNPPFGKNIVATNQEVQENFQLGYIWKYNTEDKIFYKTNKLASKVPPQVLFIEKCINLLKDGGRLGIVVPESLITSKGYGYVVEFMFQNGSIEAVLGMPEDFFKTSGKGGTHTKSCLIIFTKNSFKNSKNGSIFMAEAKWCGHDSRGKNIEHDDLPKILENYKKFRSNSKFKHGNLGYVIQKSDIDNNILSPRYYNPEMLSNLDSIHKSHETVKISDLVNSGVIEIKTGNEVGKMAYGTGNIPFVRTSDISNWEIKLDPKHGLSDEIYNLYAKKQDIQENDILMVKDGTYLIGTCAMISKYDKQMVYQSHLYKIRVLNKNIMSPYLLLALLSSDVVQEQIKSKRFTQDIIDSLGSRIYDLTLPIPKNKDTRKKIEMNVQKAIEDRMEARELARQACIDIMIGLPN